MFLLLGLWLVGCGKGGSGSLESEMNASLQETNPFVFQYEVSNRTDKDITLDFSSSQRFDYSVKNDQGEQIYLFSSVTMFMAVLGEETIKQGETLSYEINLQELDLKEGNYSLSVWLTPTEGEAYQVTKEVTVK